MTAAPRRLLLALGLTGALASPLAAQAEVWGFIDERGVAHFSSEKMDERYELYYRGSDETPSPEAAREEAREAAPRPLAVPAAPSRLIAFFEVSPAYKQVKHHLREASQTHGIDVELLQALIATESGFDAQAVSPKGAIGLMQLMPGTARRYGVSGDRKTPIERKLTDPRTNIHAGTRYLRYLINLFPGRLDLALASYNAGEGAVQRAGNRIPNYRETQNYVKTVMHLYTVLKPPPSVTARRDATSPGRVRIELPVAAAIAANRGNLPPSVTGGMAGSQPAPFGPSQPSRPTEPSQPSSSLMGAGSAGPAARE